MHSVLGTRLQGFYMKVSYVTLMHKAQWLPVSFREGPSRLTVACKALGDVPPVAALTASPTAFFFSHSLHLPGQLGYRTLKPLSPSAWNIAIDLVSFLITILLF